MSKSALMEPTETAPSKLGRQEIRTRETRELLMRAAKTIFIRDGYEGADLNDIAELAGRTKGAIYGHFKSKEEIFLALIADHRLQHTEKMQRVLSGDVRKNIAAMRQFVIDLSEDQDWALLQLEFKMFTLRHPETKERYRDLHPPYTPDREERYEQLLGAAGKGERAISRTLAVHSIMPMLPALILEAEFEPGIINKESIKTLMARIFDCLIGS